MLPYPSKLLKMVQVILEEYGKWINETTNSTMAQRNEYYAAIVNQAESLMRAANNSNLRGTGQLASTLFSYFNNAAQVSWACPSGSVLQMAGFCTGQSDQEVSWYQRLDVVS